MSTSARARRADGPPGKAAAPRNARRSGHASTSAVAVSAAEVVPSGLVYVSDDRPGIRRIRKGEGFLYRHADGTPVRNAADLERIRKLAIPPAYEDVWICTRPNGHIQATGRDARGRKQYRYHPKWRLVRDEAKYHRLVAFCRALPALRAAVERDLGCSCLCKRKVVATVVALMERAQLRVGNDEYARHNHSYGATTLRDLLCCLPSVSVPEGLGYENIFRVLIMQFIDHHAFDVRSVKKSCVHIVHPKDGRIIPFDTYNMFYRDGLEQQILEPLRGVPKEMR